MNIKILEDYLKYISFIFVLSFFAFHNIVLVLIGIIFAIFEINKNYIYSFFSFIRNKSPNTETKELEEEDRITAIIIKSEKEDIKLSLVEQIEELGFIPSLHKNYDNKSS